MNSNNIISSADRVLVTGSNGFIGVKVVESLLEHGLTNLRCFVRPSSKIENLKNVLAGYPPPKVLKSFLAICFHAMIAEMPRKASRSSSIWLQDLTNPLPVHS